MNSDQLGGLIRAVIPGAAAFLSHYFLDSATWTVVLTAASTVVVALWSFKTNTSGKTIA